MMGVGELQKPVALFRSLVVQCYANPDDFVGESKVGNIVRKSFPGPRPGFWREIFQNQPPFGIFKNLNLMADEDAFIGFPKADHVSRQVT